MKGKRKLTERLLALVIVLTMVAGMVMQPVNIDAASANKTTQDENSKSGVDLLAPETIGQEPSSEPLPPTESDTEPLAPGETKPSDDTKDDTKTDVETPEVPPVTPPVDPPTDPSVTPPVDPPVDPPVTPPEPVGKIYEVTVTAPKGPIYPGEPVSGFKAVVTLDKEEVEGAPVTWSCDGKSAEITADGTLTAAPGTGSGTAIKVTATYTSGGNKFTGTVTVTVAKKTEYYQVSGLVEDSFDKKPIVGAKIMLTASPNSADGETVQTYEAVTGPEGKYIIEKVLGGENIGYTVTCEADAFGTGTKVIAKLDSNQEAVNFELTSSAEITVEGNTEIKVGDEITLRASYPENWTEELNWGIPYGQKVIEVVSVNNREMSIKGSLEGSVTLLLSIHGKSKAVTITVSRVPGNSLTGSCTLKREDGREISVDTKPAAGETLTVEAGFQEPQAPKDAYVDGSITLELYRKIGDTEKKVSSEDGQSVKTDKGVATWTCRVPYKGDYILRYHFDGNNKYTGNADAKSSKEFSVDGKAGQSIEVTKAEFSKEVCYGDKPSFTFTAMVANPESGKWSVTAKDGTVIKEAEIKIKSIVGQKKDGLTEVTGTVSYTAGRAGTDEISICYTHALAGELVYEDAEWNGKKRVEKKDLKISSVKIPDRVYDGTNNAYVDEITLDGVIPGDNVTANTEGLLLKGKDANFEGYPLDTTKDTGKEITLAGADCKNYILDQKIDSEGKNRGVITRRPVYLKVTAENKTPITRKYGKTGNYEPGYEPKAEAAAEGDLKDIVDIVDSVEDTGFVEGDQLGSLEGIAGAYKIQDKSKNKTVVNGQKDQTNTNADLLIQVWIEESKNKNKNYELKTNTMLGAPLRIIPLKVDPYDYLTFGCNNGKVYQDEILWVKGAVDGFGDYENNDLKLELSKKEGNVVFGSVKIFPEESNEDTVINGDSIKFRIGMDTEDSPKAQHPRKISVGLLTDGTVCSERFDLNVYVDTKAPVVTNFGAIQSNLVAAGSMISDISFQHFSYSSYSVTFNLEDGGSGLRDGEDGAWRSTVVKVDDNIKDSNLQDIVDRLEDEAWSKGTGASGTVILGKGGSLEDYEGHYVVLVQTYDKLGNTKIYASNGIVLDDHSPVITFAPNTVLDSYNLEYMSAHKNVITIPDIKVQDYAQNPDPEKGQSQISSALKKVTYGVYRGGKLIEGTQKEFGRMEMFQREGQNYQYEDFQKESGITFTAEIKVNGQNYTKFDGNDLYLKVTAEDNAGKKTEVTKGFAIDLTRPNIQVKYSNESNTNVSNGIYFNGNRRAVITLTDRNISTEKMKMTLSLQDKNMNEETYTVSVGELGGLTDVKGNPIFSGMSVGQARTDKDGISKVDITLVFNGEDRYRVKYSCTDAKGNGNAGWDFLGKSVVPVKYVTDSGNETNNEFVIDKTAPVVTQVYLVDGEEVSMPAKESEQYYTQKDVNYTVLIEEHNFRAKGCGFGSDSTTSITRNRENDWSPDGSLKKSGNWQENGINGMTEQWKYTYTYKPEGNYSHQFRYADLAGNEAVYRTSEGRRIKNKTAYFTIDRTAPEGSITIAGEAAWKKLVKNITFHGFTRFFNTALTLEFTGTDNISPIYPIQYATFPQWNDRVKDYKDWKNVTDGAAADMVAKGTKEMGPNQQFVAYSKIVDKAGNVTYLNITEGVVADNEQPAPKVTVTSLTQSQNGIFNQDVTLRIDAEDPYAGNTYSGLEKVWYTVTASGNANADESTVLMDNSQNKVQGNQTFSREITVPASVYNSNAVKVQAFAADFSGNQAQSEITELKIDVTKPEISVTWDLNNPSNGKYYKETRTATVTVKERNFDTNNVRLGITNTDGTAASIGNWAVDTSGTSDEAVNTCQIGFPSDGDYTFTVSCTDLAGNSGDYGRTDEFTIDKTIPVITVSYDNNNAQNGNYYKEVRTATVSIKEHNFNASQIEAAISASLLGQGITSPTISGFSGGGDGHTATVKYEADGDYAFDISCSDLAGNAAAAYNKESFTIDKTAPEVEIFGVQDKSANNDVAAPGVRYSDNNYDETKVSFELEGANNGVMDIGSVADAIANGESIQMNDFSRDEKMDDLYKLTAKAADKAGNETKKSILFSVNRYGSVYVLDDDTKEWLSTDSKEYTYVNQEQELGIIEYNVDDVDVSRISSNRDGELSTLKENEDYTVKRSGSEAQWKEYYYKLGKDNFSKEGNYTVTLYSEDKASNKMNNESVKKAGKKLPLAFTVDKTAPTVVVSGVEDGGQYRSSKRSMTVDAKDNLVLEEVSISVDGKKTTYAKDKVRDLNGVIKAEISSANKWQTLEITARDAAGNVLGQKRTGEKPSPMAIAVLVTPNVVVQYYMNKPVFFASVGILAALAALIIALLAWRKKKNS